MPSLAHMGSRPALAGVLLVVAGAAPARVGAQDLGVRVDGIAAVIGGPAPSADVEVILRSDVELRARMALAGGDTTELPLGPLPLNLLAATLREIVGEHLIAREARKLQAATAGASERAAEHARLVLALGGGARVQALFTALGADPAELDAAAERRALVSAFLRANLEGATVVTDAQVERVLASEHADGEVPTTPDARELERRAIRARLSREALDRAIERWVSVLGARTTVQIHADYDGE